MVQLSILLALSAACSGTESACSNWCCEQWWKAQPGACGYPRCVNVSSWHVVHGVDVCFMSINETPSTLPIGIASSLCTSRWRCAAVTWRCQGTEDTVPKFSCPMSQQRMTAVFEGGCVQQMDDSGWCPFVAVVIINDECGLSRYGVIQP